MYTRTEYMADSKIDGTEAHRKYYGQFVTKGTKARVLSAIKLQRLLASVDLHFNDIALAEWDRIAPMLPGSSGFTSVGDHYTLSNGVCLAKEAARQIVEEHLKINP